MYTFLGVASVLYLYIVTPVLGTHVVEANTHADTRNPANTVSILGQLNRLKLCRYNNI